MSLRGNNYIGCIKLLSHLVGREDREGARGETTEDQREKRVVVACVPVCLRACVWQFHWHSFTQTASWTQVKTEQARIYCQRWYEMKQNNSLRSQEMPNWVSLENCTEATSLGLGLEIQQQRNHSGLSPSSTAGAQLSSHAFIWGEKSEIYSEHCELFSSGQCSQIYQTAVISEHLKTSQ